MALTSQISRPSLLQLRVLRLGSDEDGNVRVGVFPQREEILIGRFVCVALHGIGSADLEMREWAVERVKHNSAMVKDFLEIRRSRFLDERLGMVRRAHRQETGRIAFALRAISRLQSRIEYE